MSLSHHPRPLPSHRILGTVTPERQWLLACVDVVVGYTSALRRDRLIGWRLEAALTETRAGWRGGETVALRAFPVDGCDPSDAPDLDLGVLHEIAWRITDSMDGICAVVPDVACSVPDVEGLHSTVAPGEIAWDVDDWDWGSSASAC